MGEIEGVLTMGSSRDHPLRSDMDMYKLGLLGILLQRSKLRQLH